MGRNSAATSQNRACNKAQQNAQRFVAGLLRRGVAQQSLVVVLQAATLPPPRHFAVAFDDVLGDQSAAVAAEQVLGPDHTLAETLGRPLLGVYGHAPADVHEHGGAFDQLVEYPKHAGFGVGGLFALTQYGATAPPFVIDQGDI